MKRIGPNKRSYYTVQRLCLETKPNKNKIAKRRDGPDIAPSLSLPSSNVQDSDGNATVLATALTLPRKMRESGLKRVDESWDMWGKPCISRPTRASGTARVGGTTPSVIH